MRKFFTLFAALVVAVVAGAITLATRAAEGEATFSATLEQYPTSDYSAVIASFDFTEVASALNTDTAKLAAALEDGSAEFGLFNENDSLIDSNADGPGSYWMSAEGNVTNWGEGAVVYNSILSWSSEENVISIPFGQFPDAMSAGDSWSNVFTMKYNGAKVTFEVTLNVVARPEMEEPETYLPALTIVKEYEATIDFKVGQSYENAPCVIDMSDICDVLGANPNALSANIASVLLTQAVVTDESGSASISDSLVNHRASTDGWFGRHSSFDEASGEETPIAQNALHSWGGGATFYLQNPTLEDGEFTISTGQYPGTMNAESTDYAILYIVNGNKAAKVTLTVNMIAPEIVDFAEMTMAGEQVIDAEIEAANSYTSVAAPFDVNDILEKLGAENADDLGQWILGDAESLVDPVPTDYWQGEQGYAQSWGNDACCKATVSLPNGTATLMQMPRYTGITEPQTFPIHYILTNGANYYKLTFNFTINPVKQVDSELVCVGKEYFQMQIVPSPDAWIYGETYQLDMEYIEKKIGTTAFRLYGDKWNADKETLEWNKNYTCYDGDEKGAGFWFGINTYENEDGQTVVDNAGWGTNSFGFQLSAVGVITWFQYPGQRQVGESYNANIYLVNEDNGQYIQYTISVVYVDELTPEAETVGTGSAIFNVSDELVNEDGEYEVELDLSDALAAIELSADSVEEAIVVAQKSLTMFDETTFDESLFFDAEGYSVSPESDGIVLVAYLTINDEGKVVMRFDDNGFFDEENVTTNVKIGIQYNGKRYIYNYTLSNDPTTRINSVATPVDNTYAVYNLAGVKMNSLQKGINIVKMNGEVKKIYVK